jgi:histidine triad (HIT) family protein
MVTEEELKNMSPEEIAELQKQNCIFCKIIKGEIPSIKVYESNLVIAILDINPAKKGHVLILPKEHHPILPLIPPETFIELFTTAQLLSESMKKALMVSKISLFIANGAVAGQQSPHFLFHLIPRENGDGLDNFTVPKHPQKQKEQEELFPSMKHNINLMLENHFKRQGKRPPQEEDQKVTDTPSNKNPTNPITPSSKEVISEEQQEKIAQVIEQNSQVRELIKNDPEEFKRQIEQNEETKKFFEGIDIHALSNALNVLPLEKNNNSAHENEPSMEEKNKNEKTSDKQVVGEQINTNDQQINVGKKPEVFLGKNPYEQKKAVFDYFEKKPQAKDLLMKDPSDFKTLLTQREDIQQLFEHVDIDMLSKKLNEVYASTNKEEEQNE